MRATSTALVALAVLFSATPSSAQRLSADRFLTRDEFNALSSRSDTAVPVKTDALILLPTVPLTFTSLQKDAENQWHLGAAMTAGVGATFIVGKAEIDNENRANVYPWLIAGAAINAGVRENVENAVTDALTFSGFIGIGDFAISFARDLLRSETTIGLSLKMDVLTNLAPDAFMCLSGCPPRAQRRTP